MTKIICTQMHKFHDAILTYKFQLTRAGLLMVCLCRNRCSWSLRQGFIFHSLSLRILR